MRIQAAQQQGTQLSGFVVGERFEELDRELADLLVEVRSDPATGIGRFDHDLATVGLMGSALHDPGSLESVASPEPTVGFPASHEGIT